MVFSPRPKHFLLSNLPQDLAQASRVDAPPNRLEMRTVRTFQGVQMEEGSCLQAKISDIYYLHATLCVQEARARPRPKTTPSYRSSKFAVL